MKKTLYLSLCAFLILSLGVAKRAGAQTIMDHSEMTQCSLPQDSFYVQVNGFVAGQTIKTYYGDGTSDINALSLYYTGVGNVWFAHYYGASGTYTVKEVLISGGVDVDSVTFTIDYVMCQSMYVRLYDDVNSNCVLDGPDALLPLASTVEIDSAGIPVDTMTATWFLDYTAFGPIGTIYSFKVIASPHGYMPSCPSSGIVYDTVSYAPPSTHDIAFTCDPSACLDNTVSGYFSAGVTGAGTHLWVTSSSCTGVSATLAVTFSPKYAYNTFTGPSGVTASVSGNVLTFSIPSVSASTPVYLVAVFTPVGSLTLGDTVNTSFALTPLTGDCDPSNNNFASVDTIRSSYDPNYKSVSPEGNITAGTTLRYMIGFENTGNDTAHNIHINDTLSDNLDISTIAIAQSSAQPTMFLFTYLGHNIVKFDFPNINLLDSSHHGQCDAMVAFTIKTKTGLAYGTTIDNRAGIYFDINDVVMTNTVENKIGTPTSVAVMSNTAAVEVYPNPVSDQLTIKTNGAYTTLSITNTVGQVIVTRQIDGSASITTTVDVKTLPAGLYYLTVKGAAGTKVVKFEKMD